MSRERLHTKEISLATLFCISLILAGCGRIAHHPLVNIAKEEVTVNNRSQAMLGEPLTWQGTVTGRANEVDGIAAMQIPVLGPKKAATVIVEGKKFGDEWSVTLLEIRPDNGDEKLSLTA
ncbi:cytochrome c oxidase assembly factor 1 family protein, partial [Pirellulales bacterium]|nr:cytochrome c oxidase assembly factor 1 family protein [Pirellulales bacterium]